MDANNCSGGRKLDNTATTGGRTRIYKKDIDPKRIDNFSDMIKREEERRKKYQSGAQV